jgi:putative redox protein
VTAFEVRAHAERAEEHLIILTSVNIEYLVTGRDVDPMAVERAIELSETKCCPAQAMFGKLMPITLSYQIQSAE